jgi:hypothetical protein
MICYRLLTKRPTCSAKVSPIQALLAPCGSQAKHCAIPHSTEQATLPIVFLISKQAVPYQTCGSTSCSGVYTPKNQPIDVFFIGKIQGGQDRAL